MTVTWQEAVEIVVRRTHHERYRWLTSDENPDVEQREGYRRIVIAKALQPVEYPPLLTQAKTVARAAWRWAQSGFKVVSWRERSRRMALCKKCVFFDHTQYRCKECGCTGILKPWIATEVCPRNYWVTGLPVAQPQAPSPGPVDPSS
jgi:hypothetical protein